MEFADLIQIIIAGLSRGSVYGLAGLTLTLIYNATRVINFAQGDFLMLGAIMGSFFLVGLRLPLVVTFIPCILLSAFVALVLHKLVISLMIFRRSPIIGLIMATVAFATLTSQTTMVIGGSLHRNVPAIFKTTSLRIRGIALPTQDITIIIITVVVALGLFLFLRRTRLGRGIRISGINPQMAELLGVNTNQIATITFILSGGIAGLGGLLFAPLTSAHPLMGAPLLVNGFVAAIVGGIGNPFGSLVGGFVVGEVGVFVARYFSTRFAELTVYGLLILILLIRPMGLLGERE